MDMDGASSLDAFYGAVCDGDSANRLQIYPDLAAYLREPTNSVECSDLSSFLDGIFGWITGTNPKVVEGGLELLQLLAMRLRSELEMYLNAIMRVLIDRLSDKDRIQDRAATLFVKLATYCSSDIADVCERLLPAFSSKQMRLREGASLCIQKALAEIDATRLPAERLSVALATAYADPLASSSLRQVASDTLIELYRQAGESVRSSVQRSDIAADRLAPLIAKLDAVTPVNSSDQQAAAGNNYDDEAGSQGEVFKRPAATRRPTGKAGSAQQAPATASGAVNDEIFLRSFEETARVEIYSTRELTTQLQTITETITDLNKDWDRRTAAMRTLRGIVKVGESVTGTEEFTQALRQLETAFQTTMKDLRSLVIREACITIAYMAQQFGNNFEHFAEAVIPNMAPLIPNTIAVIASSAVVGIRFVIAHVHSVKFLPIITQFAGSKAKEIRAAMYSYVAQMLRDWPDKMREKQREKLLELIKKGLRDADPASRQHSREAFKTYSKYFRDSALQELETLDSRERKILGEMINRDSDGETVKSSAPAASGLARKGSLRGGRIGISHAASGGAGGSHFVLPRANSQERPLALPVTDTAANDAPRRPATKSTSEFIEAARRRAADPNGRSDPPDAFVLPAPPVRAQMGRTAPNSQGPSTNGHGLTASSSQYSFTPAQAQTHGSTYQHSAALTMAQQPAEVANPQRVASSTNVHPHAAATQHANAIANALGSATTYRTPAQRFAQAPVVPSGANAAQLFSSSRNVTGSHRHRTSAISQPGSRSNSPPRDPYTAEIARLPNAYAQPAAPPSQSRTLGRRTPQGSSTAGGAVKISRIPRSVTNSREPSPARSYATLQSSGDRATSHSPGQFCMQPDIGFINHNVPYPHYQGDTADDVNALPDDHSETSSVSLFSDSSRRYRGSEDINEIISYMASAQWQDRRNGLAGFQSFLNSYRPLTPEQLKTITDFFTRFFNDPNAKVFSALLDTLGEFIPQYRDSLYDWMYIPLTRLLLKLGNASLLGSVETRILQALDIVRNNFPISLQFTAVCRFIIDQTQTPNCKAKLATLKYLANTIEVMTTSDFMMDSDNKLAVARLITWTVDKQSPDLRKAAALCIFKLFDLSPTEFIRLLRELSRVFQDGAYKLLIVHVRGLQSASLQRQGELALSQLQLSGAPRADETSPVPLTSAQMLSPTHNDVFGTNSVDMHSPAVPLSNGALSASRPRVTPAVSGSASTRHAPRNERFAPSPAPRTPTLSGAGTGSDVENLNPDAAVLDIAKATADMARLAAANDDMSASNRTPQATAGRQPMPSSAAGRGRQQVAVTPLMTPGGGARQYNPSTYSDSQASYGVLTQPANLQSNVLVGNTTQMNVTNSAMRANNTIRMAQNATIDVRSALPGVLESLSALNERHAERKHALGTLVQLARHAATNSQANADWNEQFCKVLFALLETLKDDDLRMRYVVLLTVAQLIEINSEPFCLAPEMTILKLFEMHKESTMPACSELSAREITRYADDCLIRLGLCVPKQVTLHVVINLIKSGEYPLDLAALKLVTKLIDYERVHSTSGVMRSAVLDVLGELAPAILIAYNSPQGALRKASVFCLVSIIMLIGDAELRVYLEKLTAPKLKLLDVYIKRAQEDRATASKNAIEDSVILSQTLVQDFERCLTTFWKG